MAGARIIIPNFMPALTPNGDPVAGALLYFYDNGTTTLKTVYSSAALTTPLTNPVEADSAGVFQSIFADENEVFSVAITDNDGAPIVGLRNKDNVTPNVTSLGVNFRGTWDVAAMYSTGDIVTWENGMYMAVQSSIGEDPADDLTETYWGFLVDLTPGFTLVAGHEVYDSAYSYDINNVVIDNNVRYYSLINDNLGNTPATSPDAWFPYDFAETYSYTEALTANIPAGGGFGGDGTLGVELENAGVIAGYLDWSAANPFRVRNAANSAYLLSLSSAGLLTLSGGVAAAGALTCTTINTTGIVTVAASGIPVVVNSTNSTGRKISFQNNGVLVGAIGASASNIFIAADTAGVSGFAVSTVASAVNWFQVQPSATGVAVVVAANSATDTNVALYLRSRGSGEVRAGTTADELRITTTAVRSTVPIQFPSYTVATLPAATTAAQMIYVSDETGGAVPAFSDGTNWRRVTDRAIVS